MIYSYFKTKIKFYFAYFRVIIIARTTSTTITPIRIFRFLSVIILSTISGVCDSDRISNLLRDNHVNINFIDQCEIVFMTQDIKSCKKKNIRSIFTPTS